MYTCSSLLVYFDTFRVVFLSKKKKKKQQALSWSTLADISDALT